MRNECHFQRLDREVQRMSPKAMLVACAEDVPLFSGACFSHALAAWTLPLEESRTPFWFEREHLDEQVAALVEVAPNSAMATVHSFGGFLFRLDDPETVSERCGRLPEPDLCEAPFRGPTGVLLVVDRWPKKAHGTRWW